jgi:hypothetical protein
MSQTYLCPMHGELRRSDPGLCARCGMPLVPEGTRFALLRHLFGSPRHIALMVALMLALMAVAMMLH